MTRPRTRLILVLASAVAAAAIGDSVYAQQAVAPTTTDMASQFLDVLLGSATSTTTAVSALAAGMRIFNLAAISFGTLLFTYMVIVGTLRSAEDGELLGRKWSSMWIPLRFTAGCALLVPLASGYSTAQTGMVELAKVGSSLASQVWAESAGYLINGGDRSSSQQNSPALAAALDASMRQVLKAETCNAMMADRYALAGQFGITTARNADGSYLSEWGYTGDPATQDWSRRQCGKLQTVAFQPVTTPSTFSAVDDMGVVTEIQGPQRGDPTAVKLLIAAQSNGLLAAAGVLRPLATQITTGADVTTASINAYIAAAGATYTAAVAPALTNLYSTALDTNSLLQKTMDGGWVMAGTAMYSLARIQTEITKLEGWMPSVQPPAADEATAAGVGGGEDVAAFGWANSMGAKSKNDVANTAGRGLAQWISYKLGGDPTNKAHILVQIKEGGDSIMSWMQGILAVIGIAGIFGGGKVAALSQVAGVIPGMELIKTAGEGLGIAALLLFVSGMVMSLVLPLMPFVLWAGSVLGWLVAVLQAIIAAPVWVAAHLHPDGDDLTGKGTNGYMILLEVFLRPTFMVLGLVAALALVDIMGRWVGYAFFATVDSVQSDSWTGGASIVVLVIVYTGLTFTILRTCFGLVHDVPSTIMLWIGGANATHDKGAEFGATATGQVGQAMARAEAPMAGMAARAVGRRVANATGSGGGGDQTPGAVPTKRVT